MLFNSGVFLQFFAAFLLLYGLVRHHLAARNLLIVAASYLFYGWWDWRFLALLFGSSTFDFLVGLALEKLPDPRRRRLLLAASIVVNLVILGFFKYYNFFIESLTALFAHGGVPFHPFSLQVILPVGISFYTFQSMSYALDVYRREIPATRHFINFLAYVSFFPQLVAGPIERARHLLPQFDRTVVISRPMLEEGIWLILWGMFKKVVVADSVAPLAEMVFDHSHWSAASVTLGTIAFALQIYGDFSGYSDIARGTARVLGFDIMVNFNIPYAARNLRDFWRRWHISLSTWLRDYLYISLGGNRHGSARTYLNLLITMVLGGLWHGAAWNFALWGLWHGAGLAVHRAFSSRRPLVPSAPVPAQAPPRFAFQVLRFLPAWLATLAFVLYGWLLFRARSFTQILEMTRALGDFSLPPWTGSFLLNLGVFAAPLVLIEAWQERTGDPLVTLKLSPWRKAALQGALLIGIVIYWQREKVPFIYFQF